MEKLYELPSNLGRPDTLIGLMRRTSEAYLVQTDLQEAWRYARLSDMEAYWQLRRGLDAFDWITLEDFLRVAKDRFGALEAMPAEALLTAQVMRAGLKRDERFLEDRVKQLETENRTLKRQLTMPIALAPEASPTKAPLTPGLQKGASLLNPWVKRSKAAKGHFDDDNDDE